MIIKPILLAGLLLTALSAGAQTYVLPTTSHAVLGTSEVENSEGWRTVFQVNGTDNAKTLLSTNSIISGQWVHNNGYYGAPAGGISGTFTNHPFSLITGQVTRMIIGANGNVGIGTTNLEQKLNVHGNIFSSVHSAEGGAIILENSTKNAPNTAYRWAIYNMTGGYGNSMQFWNYGQDGGYGPKFTISDTGNVGIGTATPKEKLSVNGKIRAHEVRVEASDWPDYVFNENYRKDSLTDLEKFIRQNKHLPEIPSAKEAEKDGITLGEMNKLLLKKIEELTLHLIEKDKQIKSGDLRMSEMEKNIQIIMNGNQGRIKINQE